jgi:hypothetical protein
MLQKQQGSSGNSEEEVKKWESYEIEDGVAKERSSDDAVTNEAVRE